VRRSRGASFECGSEVITSPPNGLRPITWPEIAWPILGQTPLGQLLLLQFRNTQELSLAVGVYIVELPQK
jgi:hypothetical protein